MQAIAKATKLTLAPWVQGTGGKAGLPLPLLAFLVNRQRERLFRDNCSVLLLAWAERFFLRSNLFYFLLQNSNHFRCEESQKALFKIKTAISIIHLCSFTLLDYYVTLVTKMASLSLSLSHTHSLSLSLSRLHSSLRNQIKYWLI